METTTYPLLTILGPTAIGKTKLAATIAHQLNSVVFSADSRQVYQGMDIGTGKDLADYIIDGKEIEVYLVDLVKPGTEYNIFEYQKAFHSSYVGVKQRGIDPVFCGGSGLYLETILFNRELVEVPHNQLLRDELAPKTDLELREILQSLQNTHNTTDLLERDRLIRAIEIATFKQNTPTQNTRDYRLKPLVFGLDADREIIKKRINLRLKERLANGLVEEVERLLNEGVTIEQLMFYGLEYRYLALFLKGELNKNDMYQKLNAAICQFAKRQMTFFRHLEKGGLEIEWLDFSLSMEEKMEIIIPKYQKFVADIRTMHDFH